MIKEKTNTTLTFEDFKTEVLNDYTIAVTSRECSLLGRKMEIFAQVIIVIKLS
jgi:hypothetical protein